MKIKLLSLFFATCLAVSGTSALDWESLGPFGSGEILKMDPRDSNVIYSISHYEGVFKSTDHGKFWTQKMNGYNWEDFDGTFYAMDISQSEPDTLYFLDNYRLWKSIDQGELWFRIPNALYIDPPLFIDPYDSNHLFANYYDADYYRRLASSTDGGFTWTISDQRFTSNLAGVVFSQSNPGVVQMAAGHYLGDSTDYGMTWTYREANVIPGQFWIDQLCADPFNPANLYARVYTGHYETRGIYHSTDGGMSWNFIRQDTSLVIGVNFYVQPNKLFTQFGNSFDDGRTWQEHIQFIPQDRSVLFDPNDPDFTLFAGTEIAQVTPDGAHWYPYAFLVDSALKKIVLNPNDERMIYVLSQQCGVFKSTDSGSSWCCKSAGLIDTEGFTQLVMDQANPDILYCTGRHLFKSTDGGENWNVILDCQYPTHILIDPSDHNIIFCLAMDGDWNFTVYRSVDGGGTWNLIWADSGNLDCKLAANSYIPGLIYLSYDETDGTNPMVFYVSPDYGSTWTKIIPNLNGPPGYYPDFVPDSFAANRAYMKIGEEKGVLISDDYGLNWRNPDPNPDIEKDLSTILFVDPAKKDSVYLLQRGAIDPPGELYRSLERGASWTHFGSGAYAAFSIQHIGSQTMVYACRARRDIKFLAELCRAVLTDIPSKILMAGYGKTHLSSSDSGSLSIFCDVQIPETAPLPIEVELCYDNTPTGVFLNDDGVAGDETAGDKRYSIEIEVPPVGSAMQLKFQLIVRDATGVVSDRWPKLPRVK